MYDVLNSLIAMKVSGKFDLEKVHGLQMKVNGIEYELNWKC